MLDGEAIRLREEAQAEGRVLDAMSIAGDWEGEEEGLLRSVREGDLKAFLVEEVA